MAAFLNTVEEVSVEGNILFLPTSGTFYRTWILEDANRLSLKNMIAFYTDAPAALRLEVHLSDKGAIRRKQRKRSGGDIRIYMTGKTDDSAGDIVWN
ncbi:MAG: hypothetical protein ACLRMZ_15580 [Blautia marasmi]